MAAIWADGRGLHGEAEDGAEDEEDEDQLEAEHGPVAGPPHAPGHDPHQQGGGRHLGQLRLAAVDVDPGQVAADDRGGDQRRDDGADRHHQRALALGQRLQRLARLAVALLGAGVAALHALARASARRPAACACAAAQPPGAASPTLGQGPPQRFGRRRGVVGVADRPHHAEPPRPGLDDLLGVGRVDAADREEGMGGAAPPRARPGRGRPPAVPLWSASPRRADADVVDRQLAGRRDLLLGVGGEADDRVRAEHLPRLLRPRRRPGRRGRRRRRRRAPGGGRR